MALARKSLRHPEWGIAIDTKDFHREAFDEGTVLERKHHLFLYRQKKARTSKRIGVQQHRIESAALIAKRCPALSHATLQLQAPADRTAGSKLLLPSGLDRLLKRSSASRRLTCRPRFVTPVIFPIARRPAPDRDAHRILLLFPPQASGSGIHTSCQARDSVVRPFDFSLPA